MEIKVRQFNYQRAKSCDSLASGRLANCIAIGAIYEDSSYMVHEPRFYDYRKPSDSALALMLADLKREVTDLGKLAIYIAGGSIPRLVMLRAGVAQSRANVLEFIEQEGFSGAIKEIRWGEKGFISFLTLQNGKAEFASEVNKREIYG